MLHLTLLNGDDAKEELLQKHIPKPPSSFYFTHPRGGEIEGICWIQVNLGKGNKREKHFHVHIKPGLLCKAAVAGLLEIAILKHKEMVQHCKALNMLCISFHTFLFYFF